MAKIIRTPTRAEGGITPDEKTAMDIHAKKWIDIAMKTGKGDRVVINESIKGIYAAANLKEPRIVIVPSPLVMAFAYGASASIWNKRKHGYQATDQATDQATHQATHRATYQATAQATDQATNQATYQATYQATAQATDQATNQATNRATAQATDLATNRATYQATYRATNRATNRATDLATAQATNRATYQATAQATDLATHQATNRATYQATDLATAQATNRATYQATAQATDLATREATNRATDLATAQATNQADISCEKQAVEACFYLGGKLGLECAKRWGNVYQGGNMWSAWASCLSAARDILGLSLAPHKAFAHYENAAMHSGFRVMHEEFCIVSDFPVVLKVDAENRPHCENGPSHQWSDGWSLYHWHGMKIPAEWIENKAALTAQTALQWPNIEQRRVACEIIGWAKILKELDAKVIDKDGDPEIGTLLEVDLPDSGKDRFIQVTCGTGRIFALPVPKDCGDTALEANAWSYGLDGEAYRPEVRT